MTNVEEIEEAIERLPREDFCRLIDWIRERFGDAWDREIEQDLEAGRLEHLAGEALAEYRSGQTTPFPPDEEPSNQEIA